MSKWCPNHAQMTSQCCPNAVQMMSIWCSIDVQVMSKWCPSDVQMIFEWCPDDVQMMSKWCPNDDKMMSKWCPNAGHPLRTGQLPGKLYPGNRAIFRNRSIFFQILTRDFFLPGHESLTGRLRFWKITIFLFVDVALRAASILKNHGFYIYWLFST